MNENKIPSIKYCCNGLINFSVYPIEKLFCVFGRVKCIIYPFNRSI